MNGATIAAPSLLLTCIIDGCTERRETAGQIAGHLVEDHGWNGSVALRESRRAHPAQSETEVSMPTTPSTVTESRESVNAPFRCSVAGCTEAFKRHAGLTRHLHQSHGAARTACPKGCGQSFVSHSGLSMHATTCGAAKNRRPHPCKVCRRVGGKCARHGGPRRPRGVKKATPAALAVMAGDPTEALIAAVNDLNAQIAAAEARVKALRALQDRVRSALDGSRRIPERPAKSRR